MKCYLLLLFSCLGIAGFGQSARNKTFLVSADKQSPTNYNHFQLVNFSQKNALQNLFHTSQDFSVRNHESDAYRKGEEKGSEEETNPLGGSVACMAFDDRTNRLFFVPQLLSEIRYLDLNEPRPSFTRLENQSLHLLHNKEDIAGQISRMTIGADGFGYALSNDGEHLIRFTTKGNPVIQDLGTLIDNPANKVLVRSSCTSWGGDIVGAADGSLYLVTVRNHVFRINTQSKKCDYIGLIKDLPQEFTSNGASVDENGQLLISCGTTYGKNFSSIYQVDMNTLVAKALDLNGQEAYNISDMASSNLLFQKAGRDAETVSAPSFSNMATSEAITGSSVQVFPNPVHHGKFQIRTNQLIEKGDYQLQIQDVSGNPVMKAKMTIRAKSETQTFTFPSRNAKGVYFLQIIDIFNRTVFSRQLLVE